MLGHNDFALGAMLEERLIDEAAAARAVEHAAQHAMSPARALAALGILEARAVALVQAQIAEAPFVDPADYEIQPSMSRHLARSVAESLRAFPLFICGGIATVAMEDPLDLRAVDQLRAALKLDVDPVLCEAGALAALIERAYALSGGARAGAAASADQDLTTGREPIVAAVNQILAQGVELGASDIHIGADDQGLTLRYRVDGVLRVMNGPPAEAHAGIIQRLKVMTRLDITQTRRPQDGKLRFTHLDRNVDVRLSLIPTVTGENAVLRILNDAASIRGFDELGLGRDTRERLEAMLAQPHGILLVTGPTGSGKTTTLYTALKRLNTPDVNIVTVEDPVEIRMPMIRQVQANPEVGLTFAGALRAILRQDPDVVFVGEIRDEETARIAMQAALTGHLVLSSLHTNDAAGAVSRLRDLGCPAFAIRSSLLGVLAQRLLRRVCASCARPWSPPPEALARYAIGADARGMVRGMGCARCGNQGMRGRIGVYELLPVDETVRRAIDRDAPAQEIRRVAIESGMTPMVRDGLEKAGAGLTTLDELDIVFSLLSDDAGGRSMHVVAGDATARVAA